MPEDNGKESFEERVNIVLDELSLGIQWERPSLIVMIYRSEHIKPGFNPCSGSRWKNPGRLFSCIR